MVTVIKFQNIQRVAQKSLGTQYFTTACIFY